MGIDYDFLREVEIYVTDMNTVPVSISQDSGKSCWPSKCYKWTFGLKSGYQQVREVFNFIQGVFFHWAFPGFPKKVKVHIVGLP